MRDPRGEVRLIFDGHVLSLPYITGHHASLPSLSHFTHLAFSVIILHE